MNEYKLQKKTRFIKQFFVGLLFPAIIIGGWFYPVFGYFIPACMFGGVAIAFFNGRRGCDWYCPRGSFFDTVIAYISPKKEIPAFFKKTGTRIAMLTILMVSIALQIVRVWPDPYKIGRVFVIMLTITTSIAVILAVLFHPRVWCSFCPVGSLSSWIGRGKRPLKINSELCVECGLCHKVCPMQLYPYKFKSQGRQKILDGDCLKCGLCVSVCPKKALYF